MRSIHFILYVYPDELFCKSSNGFGAHQPVIGLTPFYLAPVVAFWISQVRGYLYLVFLFTLGGIRK